MKKYSVITITSTWTTKKLKKDVENRLNDLSSQGFEIVSVSFGINNMRTPTAFITI